MKIYQLTRVLPGTETISVDNIEAECAAIEGNRLNFYGPGLLLSLHTNHYISVRLVDEPEDGE